MKYECEYTIKIKLDSIQDFYTYINFYQNAENNQLLEKEIDKSIQNLFLNNTILVKDFFTTNSNPILLASSVKGIFVSIDFGVKLLYAA